MNQENITMNRGEIIIYQTPDGISNLDVHLAEDTVWLTQAQMVMLFERDQSVISRHINNIFKEGELDKEVVYANFAYTTPHGAMEGKTQTSIVQLYNLDVIISVGYRVKSPRGTQFRIWANKVLKEYIIKGYAVNNKLKIKQYEELKQTVKLLSNVIQNKELTADEATGLLQVITDYSYALDTLDKYDYQQLTIEETTDSENFRATYENAIEAIKQLKQKFGGSDLFANEKDQSFSDGNKRIAAFLFLWFLEKNGILYKENGLRLIENNTLVALTLMIAESRTEEKDVMVKVVVNLINRNN